MNAQLLAEAIESFLNLLSCGEGDVSVDEAAECVGAEELKEVSSVRSYGAAQVLTSDEGVVVRMADGSEFCVTVSRNR